MRSWGSHPGCQFCGLRARRSLAPPFMIPMRDSGIVEASHELASPSGQSFVAYATKVRCDRFMVRMREGEVVEAVHEHSAPGAKVHGPNACARAKATPNPRSPGFRHPTTSGRRRATFSARPECRSWPRCPCRDFSPRGAASTRFSRMRRPALCAGHGCR